MRTSIAFDQSKGLAAAIADREAVFPRIGRGNMRSCWIAVLLWFVSLTSFAAASESAAECGARIDSARERIIAALRNFEPLAARNLTCEVVPELLERAKGRTDSVLVEPMRRLGGAAGNAGCWKLAAECIESALAIERASASPNPQTIAAILSVLASFRAEAGAPQQAVTLELESRALYQQLGREVEVRAALWHLATHQMRAGDFSGARSNLEAFLASPRTPKEILRAFDDILIQHLATCEVALGDVDAARRRLEARWLEPVARSIPLERADMLRMLYRAKMGAFAGDPWTRMDAEPPVDSVGRPIEIPMATTQNPQPRHEEVIEIPSQATTYSVAVAAVGPVNGDVSISTVDGELLAEEQSELGAVVDVPAGIRLRVAYQPAVAYAPVRLRWHVLVRPESDSLSALRTRLKVVMAKNDPSELTQLIGEVPSLVRVGEVDSPSLAYLLSALEMRVPKNDTTGAKPRLRGVRIALLERCAPLDFPQRMTAHRDQGTDLWRAGRTAESVEQQSIYLRGLTSNVPTGDGRMQQHAITLAMRFADLAQWDQVLGAVEVGARHARFTAEPRYLALATRHACNRMLSDKGLVDEALRRLAEDIAVADTIPVAALREYWLGEFAVRCAELGDSASAQILREHLRLDGPPERESALETARRAYESAPPEQRPDRAQELAKQYFDAGEFAAALPLQLEVCRENQSDPEVERLHSLGLLAAIRVGLGEHESARVEFAKLSERARALRPPHHPELAMLGRFAAWNLRALGAEELLEEELRQIARQARAALEQQRNTPSLRRVAYAGNELRTSVADILALAGEIREERRSTLLAEAFSLNESARLLATAASEIRTRLLATDSDVARTTRRQLEEIASGFAEVDAGRDPDFSGALKLLALERRADELFESIQAALGERARLETITVASVAAQLRAGEIAIAYQRRTVQPLPKSPSESRGIDSYSAFVVHPDGTLRFVDLGLAERIDEAIEQWRASLEDRESFAVASTRLRESILDPILGEGLGITRCFVVPDDALHVVALDELLATRTGSSIEIVRLLGLRNLPRSTSTTIAAEARLLAFGGLVYGESGSALASSLRSEILDRLPLRSALDGAMYFPQLPGSEDEIRTVVSAFRERFGNDARVDLRFGRDGTRETFRAQASQAEYLHLAIHGYSLDVEPISNSRSQFDEFAAQRTFARLSPSSFAGLAFAGANEPDQREKLLTAAELAWLDLSRCELAVLSACESSAGVRSVGRGIASMQSAVLEAGARACVAALWPVNDRAAEQFMLCFYRALWQEGVSVEQALARARARMRSITFADGEPVFSPRQYAGFVGVRK